MKKCSSVLAIALMALVAAAFFTATVVPTTASEPINCGPWIISGATAVWDGLIDGRQHICQNEEVLAKMKSGDVVNVAFDFTPPQFTIEACSGSLYQGGIRLHKWTECEVAGPFDGGRGFVMSGSDGFRARPYWTVSLPFVANEGATVPTPTLTPTLTPTPTSTPTPTPTVPTSTPTPTATATVPTATPTPTPTPTSTPTPTTTSTPTSTSTSTPTPTSTVPTATPTSTPTPTLTLTPTATPLTDCGPWIISGATAVWDGATDGRQHVCQPGWLVNKMKSGEVTTLTFTLSVSYALQICSGSLYQEVVVLHQYEDCDFSKTWAPGTYSVVGSTGPNAGFRAIPSP